MNKRDFLKNFTLGCCSAALGLKGVVTLSKNPGRENNISRILMPENKLDKWSREARYYIQTPRGLKCQLCPNNCVLKEEETGSCRTKIVVDEKLYTIAYGNPCAVHIDPVEKKPLYHFLPSTKTFSVATAGCILACLNCQNWEISQSSPRETRNYDLPPTSVVTECIENKCNSISYTYSDPVSFYEYTFDTAKLAQEKGIRNILVSSGYIHEKPLRDICPYIDAANIDLKSFSNEIYEMLNAGTLEPVLNTLKILKEENVWLEITNLIVPQWSDDMNMIREMCKWLSDNGFSDTPLHFSRFYPQYKLTNLIATPVQMLEKAREIALEEGIHYVYIGNVPGNSAENTICPSCSKIVIERKGFKLNNFLINEGHCENCGHKIPGVWY